MKIDSHLKRLKESIEVIEESIVKGATDRQRNIGFNVSCACIDMLENFSIIKNKFIALGLKEVEEL